MKMLIKRRRLGKTYTRSPAQKTQAWLAINLGNIIFTIVITIVYFIVLYVITVGVVFMAQEVADTWHDATCGEVYNGPYGFLLKVIGMILIALYVFRDRPTSRN